MNGLQVVSVEDVEQIVESLPIAIIMTNDLRCIVAVNQAALELFEYGREELLDRELEILIPARYANRHPEMYQGFVDDPSTRQMGVGRSLAARKKSGEEFLVEVGLTVLPTEPSRYLASIVDLTVLREAEALLRDRQSLLELDLDKTRKELEDQVAARARLEERQRLGRELHDSLSQSLYGIGLGLRTATAKLERGADPSDAIDYCLGLTESALVEIRALLFKLRPKSLEDVPLADVLESHAGALSARSHLNITFEHRQDCSEELDFDRKYALFRIATEALHNCTKHACEATSIAIVLSSGRDFVELTVTDDGPGFSPTSASGHGLNTMKERAEATRGSLDVFSSEQGTTIRACIPRVAKETVRH